MGEGLKRARAAALATTEGIRRAASTARHVRGDEDVELARTTETPRGYWIRVVRRVFDSEGVRIRLELRQRDEYVRHLDMTPDLFDRLHKALGNVER